MLEDKLDRKIELEEEIRGKHVHLMPVETVQLRFQGQL